MNTPTTRPALSECLSIAPIGLLRFNPSTNTYHQVHGLRTYGTALSNSFIYFSAEVFPVADSTPPTTAQVQARAERGFTWLLAGMALLLTLAIHYR